MEISFEAFALLLVALVMVLVHCPCLRKCPAQRKLVSRVEASFVIDVTNLLHKC